MKFRHKLRWQAKLWFSRLFQQQLWSIKVYKHGRFYDIFPVRAGNYADACEKARKVQPCLTTEGWSFQCSQEKGRQKWS